MDIFSNQRVLSMMYHFVMTYFCNLRENASRSGGKLGPSSDQPIRVRGGSILSLCSDVLQAN